MTQFLNQRAFIFMATSVLFSACKPPNDMENATLEEGQVVMISKEYAPDPPPRGFASRFTSIEEWLVHLSEHEVPAQPQLTYHIALFESPEGNVLSLTGANTYDKTPDNSGSPIEYEPRGGYYLCPKTSNSGAVEVKAEATRALKEFISSDKFSKSFFAKGRAITTDWDGEIWRQ